MSRETYTTLNTQTLIGYADKRGKAWHYRAEDQGTEPNHYPGPVPAADVQRRLFAWKAVSAPKRWDVPADYDEATGMDAEGNPIRTVTSATDQVIYRSDMPDVDLGTFKSGYEIHQFADTLLGGLSKILTPDGLAVTSETLGIGSAGLLRGGRQAWVQVETPDTVKTPEGVDFRPSLLAATSHDGSISTTFAAVSTIVVCDNTMNIALGEARGSGQRIKVKHSRYSALKIEDAREALGIIVESAQEFSDTIAQLCRIEVNPKQYRQFIEIIAPVPEGSPAAKTKAYNKRSQLADLYHNDARVAPWRGTGFGLLQLANTYRHHLAPVIGASRAERNMSNAILGKTAKADAETLAALDKVLAMA